MPAQIELDEVYMSVAKAHAGLSKGIRAKVGACLVTQSGVIIPGYNGLPKPLGNDLEYIDGEGEYLTKPEVVHAELNCILKAAKEGISCIGSTCYVTLAPCAQCASMLASAGVKEVVFGEYYRNATGLTNLLECGIIYRHYQLK